jgi:hypothetical protein
VSGRRWGPTTEEGYAEVQGEQYCFLYPADDSRDGEKKRDGVTWTGDGTWLGDGATKHASTAMLVAPSIESFGPAIDCFPSHNV